MPEKVTKHVSQQDRQFFKDLQTLCKKYGMKISRDTVYGSQGSFLVNGRYSWTELIVDDHGLYAEKMKDHLFVKGNIKLNAEGEVV